LKDLLDLLTPIITIDIFIGFGLLSIQYVLITLFKRDIKFLARLDSSAISFIAFAGLIYFFLILFVTIISLTTSDSSNARGQYWLAPWLQPLIWTLVTQLFRIKRVKEIKVLRIFIAILLIISFERYVIIVTSFHHDYLPGTWTMFSWLSPSDIIFGLTTKIIVFCFLATLYTFIADRLKLFFR
jgi:hypothetical protein